MCLHHWFKFNHMAHVKVAYLLDVAKATAAKSTQQAYFKRQLIFASQTDMQCKCNDILKKYN